jgi:hypothetical protein
MSGCAGARRGGDTLGEVNRNDVLSARKRVAEQQQVTIPRTCRDSVLTDAADVCGPRTGFWPGVPIRLRGEVGATADFASRRSSSDNRLDLRRHLKRCSAEPSEPILVGARMRQHDSSTAIIDAPESSRKRNTFTSASGFESSPRMTSSTRDHRSARASASATALGTTPRKWTTSFSWSAKPRRAAFNDSGPPPTRCHTVPLASVQLRSLDGCGHVSALSDPAATSRRYGAGRWICDHQYAGAPVSPAYCAVPRGDEPLLALIVRRDRACWVGFEATRCAPSAVSLSLRNRVASCSVDVVLTPGGGGRQGGRQRRSRRPCRASARERRRSPRGGRRHGARR